MPRRPGPHAFPPPNFAINASLPKKVSRPGKKPQRGKAGQSGHLNGLKDQFVGDGRDQCPGAKGHDDPDQLSAERELGCNDPAQDQAMTSRSGPKKRHSASWSSWFESHRSACLHRQRGISVPFGHGSVIDSDMGHTQYCQCQRIEARGNASTAIGDRTIRFQSTGGLENRT